MYNYCIDEVRITDQNKILENSFYNVDFVKSVVLPDGLEKIEEM